MLTRVGLAVALIVFLDLTQSARSQAWTRFRGPNGSGVSTAQDVPTAWTGQDVRWKVKLAGMGHSSPVVWGSRLFVTSAAPDAGNGIVQCLDTADGKELWTRNFPVAKHRHHEHNSLASATPAVDDRHVYLVWASPQHYLVVALYHDGREHWRVNLGGFKSGHGFGVSPVVVDDVVIIANEQEGESSVCALERDTGTVRWRLPRQSRTTYATPCVWAPPGQPAQVIFVSYEHGITSVDPRRGGVLWDMDVFDKRHMETSIASPIVAGNLIIGASGWLGVRKEVIAVRPGVNGAPAVRSYQLTKGMPLVPTPLVKDDLLILWGDEGVVTCADASTGTIHWHERVPGTYYSSPICAGTHFYNVSRAGEVIVLKAARTFQHVATNPLGEGSHSTPAVSGNTLYIRTFTHLTAIGRSR